MLRNPTAIRKLSIALVLVAGCSVLWLTQADAQGRRKKTTRPAPVANTSAPQTPSTRPRRTAETPTPSPEPASSPQDEIKDPPPLLVPEVPPQQPGQPQETPTPKPTPKPTPEAPQTVGEDEIVRVETDLTNVLFTATDKNRRFLTNLRQEDLRIYEDGQAQEIFTFSRQTDLPLSLALLIDTSASEERTLPYEKEAATEFINAVIRRNKDEVAVISFTGEATLEQGLTGNLDRARRAIDRVEFIPPAGYVGGGVVVGTPPIAGDSRAGSTAIWDAIYVTSDEVLTQTSDKTRRAIILLTDGADTSSRWKRQEAIDRAVKTDAVIYCIGIGDDFYRGVDEGTLRKIADQTGGRAFFPRNEADLRQAFAQIQDELRSQYLIAYSSTNKNRDGSFRQVRLEIANPELAKEKLKLTYRQGYYAKKR